MKKCFVIVLGLTLFLTSVAHASDFKDNSFKLDSSRIEQEKEEDTLGNQSTLIKDLFSESDQRRLADLQENQLVERLGQKEQLFATKQAIPPQRSTEKLFIGAQQGLVETKVDVGSAERQIGPLWLSLLYTSLVVAMLLGATYMTYRIYTRE